MKRVMQFFCLALAFLMLTPCIVGCSKKEKEANENDSSQTQTDIWSLAAPDSALIRSGLEKRDYSGKEMTIWYSTENAWSPYPLEISAEDGYSSDIITSAGYERNTALQQLVNVKLNFMPTAINGWHDDIGALRNLNLSGETETIDMVISCAKNSMGLLAQEGFFYNLNDSSYINVQADYYESIVNSQIPICGKQYFALGYYSVMNTSALSCTWGNEEIIQNTSHYSKYDLYQMVFNKEWTVEKMLEIGKHYANPTADQPTYALIMPISSCRQTYYNLGGTVVEYNDNTWEYNVTVNSEKNQELFSWIHANLTGNENVVFAKDNGIFKGSFESGLAPFMSATLYQMRYAHSSEMNWFTLPEPTLEKGEDYRSFSTCMCLWFAGIPLKCSDIDRASYLYELFMCLSYDYVYPAYFENCFGVKYQPDEVGAQIFNILASSRIICLANIYDFFGVGSDREPLGLVQNKNLGVASTTKIIAEDVKSSIEKFFSNLK